MTTTSNQTETVQKTDQSLLIRCSFRSRGYNEDEISTLGDDLSSVAKVQFRRQGIPDAGASFDIEFVVSWVGQVVLSGVIGNYVYDQLKTLSANLSAFYHRKLEVSKAPPETYVLELRFDDVDLRIRGINPENDPDSNFLNYETIARLPDIVDYVFNHLRSEPLSGIERQVIHICEPHPTMTSSDLHGLLFTHPWRIEGSLKMDLVEYHPHERRLSGA